MIEYLDLFNLFVNDMAGSATIFIFLGIIFIAYVAAQYQFNTMLTLLLIVVYALIFGALTEFRNVFLIAIFLIAFFIAGYYFYRFLR